MKSSGAQALITLMWFFAMPLSEVIWCAAISQTPAAASRAKPAAQNSQESKKNQPTPDAQYHFDVWTTDNGLPQNSVGSILQSRDGFLWFTTNDGLVRYDGVHFTVFNAGN